MREDTALLLGDIAHCPVVAACKSGQEHPCARVVAAQADLPLRQHQVPEPWSGRLEEALVLFVGTSPAIARGETYPLWPDDAAEVAGFFEDRFGDGPRQVRDGVYPPIPGRHSTTPLQLWVEVKARAAELVDDPVPGRDYAMTYAVHCRTEGEVGVRRAMTVCPDRYLARVVAAAPRAHVLVALGPHARAAVRDVLGVAAGDDARHVGPVQVEGRERHVVFLDHFGGYGAVKDVASAVEPRTLQRLRAELARLRPGPPAAGGPLALVLQAFRDLPLSFGPGEARWLAQNARLADAALARAGWLLQRSAAEQGLDVRLLARPAGLVALAANRPVVCCDYDVVPAADCLVPGGADRAAEWALHRVYAPTDGSLLLPVLAVPGDGSADGGVLDDVAGALLPRLAGAARVERVRLADPDGGVACLDVYLAWPADR